MQRKIPRILIIDDDAAVRRSLVAYLEDEGFEVITTGSSEEGLGVLSAVPVDVSVVDIRLPGMDGTEFILQGYRTRPETKFLICTGSVEYKSIEGLKSIGLGDEWIFRKPLADLSVLVKAIKALLGEERLNGR
jgi:two-component system OmpR family response regulator